MPARNNKEGWDESLSLSAIEKRSMMGLMMPRAIDYSGIKEGVRVLFMAITLFTSVDFNPFLYTLSAFAIALRCCK